MDYTLKLTRREIDALIYTLTQSTSVNLQDVRTKCIEGLAVRREKVSAARRLLDIAEEEAQENE